MAIEGRSEAALGRRIRLGMVGGGEGAFIGAVHRLAARMDDHYEFVAGALSSTPEKARRSGEALGLDPDRTYRRLRDDGQSRGGAARRHRGGGDRHAQPYARRADHRLSRSGRACDQRQAADDVARRGAPHPGGGREVGPRLRADAQLHRLSPGAPRARDDRSGRTRRHPHRAGRISPGMADRDDRDVGPQAGGMARRSGAAPASAARSATSARTPTISPTT